MPNDSDAAVISTSTAGHSGESKYDRLIAKARSASAVKTVVAHPCDESSLRGAVEAAEAGIIDPILVGPADKIKAVAREHKIDIGKFEIVDVPHGEAASAAKSDRRSSRRNSHKPIRTATAIITPKLVTSNVPIWNRSGYIRLTALVSSRISSGSRGIRCASARANQGEAGS